MRLSISKTSDLLNEIRSTTEHLDEKKISSLFFALYSFSDKKLKLLARNNQVTNNSDVSGLVTYVSNRIPTLKRSRNFVGNSDEISTEKDQNLNTPPEIRQKSLLENNFFSTQNSELDEKQNLEDGISPDENAQFKEFYKKLLLTRFNRIEKNSHIADGIQSSFSKCSSEDNSQYELSPIDGKYSQKRQLANQKNERMPSTDFSGMNEYDEQDYGIPQPKYQIQHLFSNNNNLGSNENQVSPTPISRVDYLGENAHSMQESSGYESIFLGGDIITSEDREHKLELLFSNIHSDLLGLLPHSKIQEWGVQFRESLNFKLKSTFDTLQNIKAEDVFHPQLRILLNPRQVYRIIKRRLIRNNKRHTLQTTYRYESRHEHALNRFRNKNGRW